MRRRYARRVCGSGRLPLPPFAFGGGIGVCCTPLCTLWLWCDSICASLLAPPCLQLPCGLQLPSSGCMHPSRVRFACWPVSLHKREIDGWCNAVHPSCPTSWPACKSTNPGVPPPPFVRVCAGGQCSAGRPHCVAVPVTCGCSLLCVWSSRRGVLALSWPTEQLHCPAGVATVATAVTGQTAQVKPSCSPQSAAYLLAYTCCTLRQQTC